MSYQEFIREAQAEHFWLGLIPGVLMAGSSFAALFRNLNHLRLIADTPASLIRSASQGYVELQGTTWMMDGEPIIAPLSGRRCVWYRYRVEEKSQGKNEWRVVEQGLSEAIFHISDGTGRCIVDPCGAEVIPSSTRRWRGNKRRPGGLPQATGFWDQFLAAGPYRFTESLIDEGAPIYIIGFLQGLATADPGTTNDAVRQLVRRWKQDPAAMRRRFDADGDGVISPAEWEFALGVAEKEVMLNWHQAPREVELNLIREPGDGRLFLLSTVSEQVLVRRYRRRVLLSAGLFLLFGMIAAWALYLRFFPP
jgi:hypothetical protein